MYPLLPSDLGNNEVARRWVLRVRYPTGPEVTIPLQVMASLKRIEGRLKKAPRRVPMKRRNDDGISPGPSTAVASGVAPVMGPVAANEDDEAVIRWLVKASENKFRRMSRNLRQLKKKEYAMKGHHLPVER